MKDKHQPSRRSALKQITLGAAALGIAQAIPSYASPNPTESLKGNIRHSVCQWTYGFLSLEELCKTALDIGFTAIDLIGPKGWGILKKHGIDSSMCNGAEINLVDGWIDPQFHPTLIKNYREHIDLVKKAGYKNLICFSGNRRGMDDETGLKNMTEGIKQIIGQAEKAGVTIQIEVFNSKVDHPDYMADKSAWAVELCKQIGSDHFKILYDIYHMQIDEGDVIRTIQDNHEYFGHYHTAGVPGRNEIDETQELYYPAIMQAIAKTGYKGYVAQEFIPTGKKQEDKILALKKAIHLCDV